MNESYEQILLMMVGKVLIKPWNGEHEPLVGGNAFREVSHALNLPVMKKENNVFRDMGRERWFSQGSQKIFFVRTWFIPNPPIVYRTVGANPGMPNFKVATKNLETVWCLILDAQEVPLILDGCHHSFG